MVLGSERPSDEFLRKIHEAGTDEEIVKIIQAERRNNEEKAQAELLQLMRTAKQEDVAKFVMDARTKRMDARQKGVDAFTAKSWDVQVMITRGLGFVVELPRETDMHYAGKGVSLGAPDTPIFWYRPKDAKKYRVIHADLSVREADAPPNEPDAQSAPAPFSPKK